MSALSGVAAAVLFLAGTLVVGERPDFDAGGAELVAYLADNRTRIQVGCALFAIAVPLFVWFLVVLRGRAPARTAATVMLTCGAAFLTLFLADVTTLAVGALRPRSPEVASALQDFEFLAMGMAAPLVAAMLLAFATSGLGLRWLAIAAAALYALRLGTLFTTDGPFAADGVLGVYVPVAALLAWLLITSLTLRPRGAA